MNCLGPRKERQHSGPYFEMKAGAPEASVLKEGE